MNSYYDVLKETFTNMVPLDKEFYVVEPYKTNQIRRCKIIIILNTLCSYEEFRVLPNVEQNQLAKKIEVSCFNAAIRKSKEDNKPCSWETSSFVNLYHNLVYERITELDFENNKYLVKAVIERSIDPSQIGFLTDDQLNPLKNINFKEKNKIRRNIKIQRKIVTCYTCPDCGANEATYEDLQLRSLDEAKSTVVTCQNCGHIWTYEK